MNRTLLPATEVLNRWATSSARRARLEGEEPGQPWPQRGEDGQDPIRRLRSGSRVGFEPLKGGNLYPPPSALRQPEGVERGGGLRSGVGLPSPIFSTRPRGAGSRGRKGTPKPPRPLRPQARQRGKSASPRGRASSVSHSHEDAPLGILILISQVAEPESCWPAPPLHVSFPKPPERASLPRPPKSLSLAASPFNTSSPTFPRRTSSSRPPLRLSLPGPP